MKESMFNVYLLDEKEKECLVFNTMHRSIIQVDEEIYSLMKENRITEIDDEVLNVLKEGEIIVEDDLNELDMLKIIFNRGKYNTDSIGITVIPTHLCNLACKYCYQGHGEVLSHTMDKKTVKRTIAFIKKSVEDFRSFGVNLYGGEAFLVPDVDFLILEELKSFADEQGKQMEVTIASNGTLFTEAFVKRLKKYDPHIQITLCGPKEVHDQIRVDKKGNGTYERLMEVIALFLAHNISFIVRVDIDRDSYDMIPELLEDLKRRGFGGIRLGFCLIGKEICYTAMELESEEITPVELAHLSKRAHDMGFKTNPLYINNFMEVCSAIADNYLAVDPKGDVYKCLAAPNYPEHRLGTIDDAGDLIDMNRDAYCKWTLRDPLVIKECVTCKFAPICAGGCALNAYSKHGDINTPGCDIGSPGYREKDLAEIVRTYIMLEFPELFEECTYESIIL